MNSVLQRPIKRLPAKRSDNTVVDVDVAMVPMTNGLIKLWDSHVQPLVDANYRHHSHGATTYGIRADVGWRWSLIVQYARLHTLSRRLNNSGPALAMCMVVQPDGAPEFPIGMLTTVPRFYCDALSYARHRGFAWYLADAPTQVYQKLLKCPIIRGVAKALLDCSIQASLDASLDGTLLLHADPKGGDKLINFYQQRCGMIRLPPNQPPITMLWRRGNSEEYFHFDHVQAEKYCAQYDHRRS